MEADQREAKRAKTNTKATREEFLSHFEDVLNDILSYDKANEQLSYALEHLERMYRYNVPHGKLNRGMAVLEGVRAIRKEQLRAKHGEDATLPASEERLAIVVGWCIELLQAFFLVEDDIMDGSYTRRGQECWYRKQGVGMTAINDGIIMESAIYRLLKLHASSHPNYVDLLELFHDATFKTASGQLVDLISAPPEGQVDFSRYTMETYMHIVTFKTAYYTIYLPAVCAMLLCNISGKEELDKAREICLEMGRFFQIQDDVLDCFADPSVLGKVGTDIQDNKCTWLIVKALEKGTEQQKEVLKNNYGRSEEECVDRVKATYKELGLYEEFQHFEEESYQRLTSMIHSQTHVPPQLFTDMLDKIYKRSK